VHAVFFTRFFFQAADGIRDATVTGVQTCALPIFSVCRFTPVPWLMMVTLALATSRPLGSLTSPVMSPSRRCAEAERTPARITNSVSAHTHSLAILITSSLKETTTMHAEFAAPAGVDSGQPPVLTRAQIFRS